MSLNITQTEINTLWDKGYRPFEIYTSNPEPVMYHGKMEETNAVGGWDIKHIFATRDEIENYPNFDCIIMIDSVAYCTEIFHGNEDNTNCLTKNQTKAMEVLVKSGMENTGAKCIEDMMDDPMPVVQASDLVKSGWSQKQAEGTFGSLVASGHILHDEGGNAANDLYVLDGEEEKFENLRQFVAPKETSETLIDELEKWRLAQGFKAMCAMELIYEYELTPKQSTWIENFMKRWDNLDKI